MEIPYTERKKFRISTSAVICGGVRAWNVKPQEGVGQQLSPDIFALGITEMLNVNNSTLPQLEIAREQ